ncbi:MAG: RIP metalloprotease RseP [Parcubacteria group bacterium]
MLTTIILFILILGLLIFVHELGHFVMARRMGVKVEEFGMGFPPRIAGIYRDRHGKWKKVIGNKETDPNAPTVYSLNWLPIGGFCKIKGEDDNALNDEDSFANKKIWQRSLILIAGVTMNILLAMILLIAGFKIGLPVAIDESVSDSQVRERKVQVMAISDGSPAALAGIQVGDQVLSVAGQVIDDVEQVQELTKASQDQEITVGIKREEQEQELSLTPRSSFPENDGPVGVSLVETGIVSYPWHQAIIKGIVGTFALLVAIVLALFNIIKNLLVGAGVTEEISGPVGIAVMTGQMARMGYVYILQFIAILSVNLAIINLFPIPALDGGRLIFLAVEKIRGKKVGRRLENTIHMIGFVLLLLLMLAITFRDVFKFRDIFINLGQKIIGQ